MLKRYLDSSEICINFVIEIESGFLGLVLRHGWIGKAYRNTFEPNT